MSYFLRFSYFFKMSGPCSLVLFVIRHAIVNFAARTCQTFEHCHQHGRAMIRKWSWTHFRAKASSYQKLKYFSQTGKTWQWLKARYLSNRRVADESNEQTNYQNQSQQCRSTLKRGECEGVVTLSWQQNLASLSDMCSKHTSGKETKFDRHRATSKTV